MSTPASSKTFISLTNWGLTSTPPTPYLAIRYGLSLIVSGSTGFPVSWDSKYAASSAVSGSSLS